MEGAKGICAYVEKKQVDGRNEEENLLDGCRELMELWVGEKKCRWRRMHMHLHHGMVSLSHGEEAEMKTC